MVALTYQIGTNEVDGVTVELPNVDTLEVFFADELNQTIEIEPGQRAVPLVFDVTDLEPGSYPVRFDLYSNGELVSTDDAAVPVN